jgi:hypothetical protein
MQDETCGRKLGNWKAATAVQQQLSSTVPTSMKCNTMSILLLSMVVRKDLYILFAGTRVLSMNEKM